MLQAQADTARRPGRWTTAWIVSPRQDLLWLIGGAATGWGLFLLHAAFQVDMLLVWFLWFVLLDSPHFFGTWARTYLDIEEWRHRRGLLLESLTLFLMPPLVLAAAFGLHELGVSRATELVPLLAAGVNLWAYWHVVRQHYGILALYRRKNADLERPRHRVADHLQNGAAARFCGASSSSFDSDPEVDVTAPSFLLLTETDLRSCVKLDADAMAAVEDGFTRLGRGEVLVPPPIGIDVPERQAEVHVKTAYVRGLSGFAIKVASGFYRNRERGLPVSSGLMVLHSAETGWPQCLLLDNAYLTDVRTALAGAIAAKYQAKQAIETVGVVGVGVQARFQVEALRLVRSFRRVVVYGRRPEAVHRYISDVSKQNGVEVLPANSVSEVVRRSEVVITATPAREPLFPAADAHEGLHVTAMGSDGPGKQELDPALLARADVLCCDLKSQCFRLGELQHGLRTGAIREDGPILELAQLTAGTAQGRHHDSDVTVCDLTGVGVQDTAIAVFALERAQAAQLGTRVAL